MKEIKAKSIVMVDTISKGNIKPWQKLMEYMEGVDKDEQVNFVFENLQVYQPWVAHTFIQLMSDPRVHLTFFNDEKMVVTVELMLKLNGYPTGRVINHDTQTNSEVDKKNNLVRDKATGLQPYFHTNPDGSVNFNIKEVYDQIGGYTTVDYIEAAMIMRHEMTGERDIILNLENVTIYANVIESISKLMDTMEAHDVNLDIVSNDESVNSKIGLYRGLQFSQAGSKEHFEICKTRLKDNVVGMLAKYRDSKGKDEFGRHGRGEIVTNRIAIFRGFAVIDGQPALKFQVFNGKTFFPRNHWFLENDGQILLYRTGRDMTPVEVQGYNDLTSDDEYHSTKKMEVSDITIPLSEVGIYNEFLGSKYHFMAPVQRSKNESRVVFDITDSGYSRKNELTIPELAKKVLSDYGIEFNRSELDECIAQTNQMLSSGTIEDFSDIDVL